MIQRIPAGGLFHMPDKVQIKEILPWLASERPGLDLGQIDIAQRESAQRSEQRARQVARRENQSGLESLCGARRSISRAALRSFQQKKPSKVFAVVLNRLPDDPRTIDLRRIRGRDG